MSLDRLAPAIFVLLWSTGWVVAVGMPTSLLISGSQGEDERLLAAAVEIERVLAAG